MSRSKKKHPYVGNCAESDKWSKKNAHKKFRRRINALLDTDIDREVLPVEREIDHAWDFAKDGKHRWDDPRGYRK